MEIPETMLTYIYCPDCNARNPIIHGDSVPKALLVKMFNPVRDCYSCSDRFQRFMKAGGFLNGETIIDPVRDSAP